MSRLALILRRADLMRSFCLFRFTEYVDIPNGIAIGNWDIEPMNASGVRKMINDAKTICSPRVFALPQRGNCLVIFVGQLNLLEVGDDSAYSKPPMLANTLPAPNANKLAFLYALWDDTVFAFDTPCYQDLSCCRAESLCNVLY